MLPTAYYREFPDELLRPSRRANLFRGAGALISLARSPNALPRRRASPIPAGPDRPAFQAEPRLSLWGAGFSHPGYWSIVGHVLPTVHPPTLARDGKQHI